MSPLPVFVRCWIGCLLLLSAVLLGAAPVLPSNVPAVGDAARDFALATADGKTIRLSELTAQGPVVVVMLRGWVGYQCPLCTRQVAELAASARELSAAGAKVVLIYPGAPELVKDKAQEFMAGRNLPEGFLYVTDPGLKVVNDWNLRWNAPNETVYPSTFVVDGQNKIRFAKISTTHGDRAPTAEVLKALAGLKTQP
jgi:peroxiredoxin Q/BCP